jgi:putative RNA 2'-phosphotransferase
VDLGLIAVTPPEILYHGTGTKYLDDIWKDGLIPKSRQYVHLSKDIPTATDVGKRHGNPVVFEINSGVMHRRGYTFYCSENGVWLTEHVPVEFLNSSSYESPTVE